jgi:hypothetical protein
VCVCRYICMHVRMYVCIYVGVCVCMCLYSICKDNLHTKHVNALHIENAYVVSARALGKCSNSCCFIWLVCCHCLRREGIGGSKDIAPLILNLRCRWLWRLALPSGRLTLGKYSVSIE